MVSDRGRRRFVIGVIASDREDILYGVRFVVRVMSDTDIVCLVPVSDRGRVGLFRVPASDRGRVGAGLWGSLLEYQ
jgi:hypothetical protein